MVTPALLFVENKIESDYLFTYLQNYLKSFSKLYVVVIGSEVLLVEGNESRCFINIPLPHGFDSIYELNDKQFVSYSNRIIDLVLMETGLDEDDCYCFFQNFRNYFLIPDLKTRTIFKICSFFNEHSIDSDYLNRLERLGLDGAAGLVAKSDSIVYTSDSVADFLQKTFQLDENKMHRWEYRTQNLIADVEALDRLRNSLRIVPDERILLCYGNLLSMVSILILSSVISRLINIDSGIRIVVFGSFNYDLLLENINEGDIGRIIFTGRANELLFCKLLLLSSCVWNLSEVAITDNTFLLALENDKPFVAGYNTIPIEYRKNKNFCPLNIYGQEEISDRDIAYFTAHILKNASKPISYLLLREGSSNSDDKKVYLWGK